MSVPADHLPVCFLSQPIPGTTDADVDRVLDRDFPGAARGAAGDAVKSAGSHHRGSRVRLGALKEARGDFDRLRDMLRQDPRDCMGWAEYPEYGRDWLRADTLTPEELAGVYARDFLQYRDWLGRADLAWVF